MYYRNKTQKINELKKELLDYKPSRCSVEDIEEVSDNYQANLEYQWWRDEVLSEMQSIRDMSYKEFDKYYNSKPEEVIEVYKPAYGELIDGIPNEEEY